VVREKVSLKAADHDVINQELLLKENRENY
jgi:hypothetical protein